MDGNKDESEKCIAIALKYVRTGDKEKALKFLNKAQRLFPSKHASVLIDQLTSSTNGSAASGEVPDHNEGSSAAGTHHSGPRFRGTSTSDREEPVQPKYTQDQLTLVRKIQRCKDKYYDVLSVSKDFTEDDLKKAYRKLALKLHPDKNHAPGATEAFKAVAKAFAVLNDPEKKRHYDLYGTDVEKSSHHHHHQHSHHSYYYDEDDVSAEEIFNMFFGGGYPSGRVNRSYRRRAYHFNQQQEPQQQSEFSALLQLSPFLFIILLSVLGSFLIPDSPYSLNRDGKYNHERRTQNLGVIYYVKPDFHTEYRGSMRKLETQIEDEYVANLRNNCFRERSYKENMAWRARNFGDGRLYEKAQNLKTPSCDKLQQLYGG